MNPILQLQDDFAAKLLSESLLVNINVVKLRALQLDSVVARHRIWATARNGKSGAGILVGIPSLEHPAPNVPGPERRLLLPVSVFEQPSINALGSTGTGLTAEEIVDYIDALIARLGVEGLGNIYCDSTIPNLETESGIIRYDMVFVCQNVRTPIEQVAVPSLAEASLSITLTNHASYPDALIYYTLDDSFPGPGNTLAQSGASPLSFTVTSGSVVRWSAYQTGMAGSDVGRATIT